MAHLARRVFAAVLVVLVTVTAAPSHLGTERMPRPVGDGQRGLNISTLITQSVTIFDHPDETNTGEPQASYNYLASRGHKLIRLGISWDYLQPGLDTGDRRFHPSYWRAIKAEVAKIRSAGLKTVLDLHNGCEWTKPKTATPRVCGAGLSIADTTDVWRQLSSQFRDDPGVIAYDLFNEPTKFNHPTRPDVRSPQKQPFSTYQNHVNAVVAAIRADGDGKNIWVGSLCCNMIYDFAETVPGGGWVADPLRRIVYTQHMYPASNSTVGEAFDPAKTSPDYERPKGSAWADFGYARGFLGRLDRFAAWCLRSDVRCAVGEVGWYDEGQSPESAVQWNALGERWYDRADFYGLTVTYYGASSADHGGLWAYDAPGPDVWYPAAGLSRARAQAAVLERPAHLSRP